jgi:hypothetical protein
MGGGESEIVRGTPGAANNLQISDFLKENTDFIVMKKGT